MQEYVERARHALNALDSYSQSEVDALVKCVAQTVFDHAEPLARMAHDETRMGVYEDKVLKNRLKAELIWLHLKGKPSVGVIARHQDTLITEVARPVGVVGALSPVTNPTTTPMCNVMLALKGRNSIVVAPHPSAKRTTTETIRLINAALSRLGAPPDLVQVLEEPSIDATHALMREVDVVVATGGTAMVQAAYTSGRPAYGVGPGNVQVIMDRAVDAEEVADKVLRGRAFDNGIICSCEQSLHYPGDARESVITALKNAGGFLLDSPEAIGKIRATLFPNGKIAKSLIGQSVEAIAKQCDIQIPQGIRVILIDGEMSPDDVLRREKMFPVLSLFPYKTLDDAIHEAHTNLLLEGAGHSCVVHSNDVGMIEKVALSLPVSRIIVNQTSPTAAGGSFFNSLTPSTTLGCGTWGHNSLSENLDYRHLLNIQRIAYPISGAVPSPKDIWL